ncbi:hypothetical protein EX30DRAFT_292905, partial [Ascodesmis nigricans]
PVLNIISSHKLSAKTTRCLAILYPSEPSGSPAVGIRAKGPAAAKAITLVELVKQRIEEKGDQWWQYNVLEPQHPTQATKAAQALAPRRDLDESGDEGTFTSYLENPKNLPLVPLMIIYLSLSPIPDLASKWGEQT